MEPFWQFLETQIHVLVASEMQRSVNFQWTGNEGGFKALVIVEVAVVVDVDDVVVVVVVVAYVVGLDSISTRDTL